MTLTVQEVWETVCRYSDLLPERPVAALVDGEPIAVVRTYDGAVYAVAAVDPDCGAAVMPRGIVGDRGGVPVLISPMYKQAYSLVTGECLTKPGLALAVHPVRMVGAEIQVLAGG